MVDFFLCCVTSSAAVCKSCLFYFTELFSAFCFHEILRSVFKPDPFFRKAREAAVSIRKFVVNDGMLFSCYSNQYNTRYNTPSIFGSDLR